jgi:hypothetical protein
MPTEQTILVILSIAILITFGISIAGSDTGNSFNITNNITRNISNNITTYVNSTNKINKTDINITGLYVEDNLEQAKIVLKNKSKTWSLLIDRQNGELNISETTPGERINIPTGLRINEKQSAYSQFGPDNQIITPTNTADNLVSVLRSSLAGNKRAALMIAQANNTGNSANLWMGLNGFCYKLKNGGLTNAAMGCIGGSYAARMNGSSSGTVVSAGGVESSVSILNASTVVLRRGFGYKSSGADIQSGKGNYTGVWIADAGAATGTFQIQWALWVDTLKSAQDNRGIGLENNMSIEFRMGAWNALNKTQRWAKVYSPGTGRLSIRTDKLEMNSSNVSIRLGNSTTQGRVSAYFVTYSTTVSNSGTNETQLFNSLLPTALLSKTGSTTESYYAGRFISSATATRQLKAKFAGITVFDSSALTLSANAGWVLTGTVMRVNATGAKAMYVLSTSGVTTEVYTQYTELNNLNFGSSLRMNITGTAAGAGAATGDISAKMGYLQWIPNAG